MNLVELRKQHSQLIQELETELREDMTKEEIKSWDDKQLKADNIEKEIKELEKEEERKKEEKENQEKRMKYIKNSRSIVDDYKNPAPNEKPELTNHATPRSEYKPKFRSIADQMKSIKRFYTSGQLDERQEQMENELRASGMNTQIGSDGGFLIEPTIGTGIFDTAVEQGEILSRVTSEPTSSNEIKFPMVDEDDVSDTLYGGIKAYWASEAGTVSSAKPKLKQESAALHKLIAIAYSTEELEEDSNFANAFYKKAFSEAITRRVEESIIGGTGSGKPLGILSSDNLITVAKESGQATNTFLYKNINKMWNRLPSKIRKSAIWLMNPDGELYLQDMTFPIGTGGVPVYLPAGGMSVEGYASLKGRPVVTSDQMSSFSSKGDIMLVDLSDYMLLVKSGKTDPNQAKLEVSMHVQFLYGENTYRIIFRVGGRPMSVPVTIKNSSSTRGKYITLASR